jgi:hypothetical protein
VQQLREGTRSSSRITAATRRPCDVPQCTVIRVPDVQTESLLVVVRIWRDGTDAPTIGRIRVFDAAGSAGPDRVAVGVEAILAEVQRAVAFVDRPVDIDMTDDKQPRPDTDGAPR